jgi:hypothetical protein
MVLSFDKVLFQYQQKSPFGNSSQWLHKSGLGLERCDCNQNSTIWSFFVLLLECRAQRNSPRICVVSPCTTVKLAWAWVSVSFGGSSGRDCGRDCGSRQCVQQVMRFTNYVSPYQISGFVENQQTCCTFESRWAAIFIHIFIRQPAE